MAVKQWYLANAVVDGWQSLTDTTNTAATLTAGWVVSTGSTFSSEHNSGAASDRAATTFTANTVPDGSLDTSLKDAFRTPLLNGSFASANWTFQFAVQSPTQGGAAGGQIVFRLIRADFDGSNAVEITSAQQSASAQTLISTTDKNSTLTFNPGAFTITNQYLFVQVAWKRTVAGGMTTTNIRLRTGSAATPVGSTVLSADFTPATQTVTGVNIGTTGVRNVPVVANTQLVTGVHRATTLALNLPTVAFATAQSVAGQTIYPGAGVGLTLILENATWEVNNQKVASAGCNWSQTFTGPKNAVISAVSLQMSLSLVGTTPTDYVYVQIRDGSFTGTLLGTSETLSAADMPAAGTHNKWVTFSFLYSPATIASGGTYWLSLYTTRVATDDNQRFGVYFTLGDTYAGGEMKTAAGATFAVGDDLAFRLWERTGPGVVLVDQTIALPFIYPTSRAAFYTETLYASNLPIGSSPSANLSWAGVQFYQTIPAATTDTVTVIAMQIRKKSGTPTDGLYLIVRTNSHTTSSSARRTSSCRTISLPMAHRNRCRG